MSTAACQRLLSLLAIAASLTSTLLCALQDLPEKGAVSLSTMHDLQWRESDLDDGDSDE
eukprot:COSAG04_NODE_12001_length_676_cov_1.433276_3_plen_58_part_01